MKTTADIVIVKDARPFDGEKTRKIVEEFHRDGFIFWKMS